MAGGRRVCVVVNCDHVDCSGDVTATVYADFESAVHGTLELARQRMSYRRGSKYEAKWWLPKNAWRKAEEKLRSDHFLRIHAIHDEALREHAFDDDAVTWHCEEYLDWHVQPDTEIERAVRGKGDGR